MFQPKTRRPTLGDSEATRDRIGKMTSLTLSPRIRDYVDMLLGRRAGSEPSRSGKPNPPQSREERHELIDEMLLTNPAICASEFGVQWMYTRYGRD
jgi:hypothetical protein